MIGPPTLGPKHVIVVYASFVNLLLINLHTSIFESQKSRFALSSHFANIGVKIS